MCFEHADQTIIEKIFSKKIVERQCILLFNDSAVYFVLLE